MKTIINPRGNPQLLVSKFLAPNTMEKIVNDFGGEKETINLN